MIVVVVEVSSVGDWFRVSWWRDCRRRRNHLDRDGCRWFVLPWRDQYKRSRGSGLLYIRPFVCLGQVSPFAVSCHEGCDRWRWKQTWWNKFWCLRLGLVLFHLFWLIYSLGGMTRVFVCRSWISEGLHEILNTEKQLRLESLKAIKDITQSRIFICGAIVEIMKQIARQLRISTPSRPHWLDFVQLFRLNWENVRESNQ